MFKSLLKKVKPLFLVSLLVLAVLAILSLGPVLTYPASLGVATYYEGSTTVVKGTAAGGTSTANLDADDGVYYAVNCASASVPQSQTLTYYSTVSADVGWYNVPYIDADDTNYASATAKSKTYWVEMDDHTISGTITSVVIKIDCWTNADDVKEFTLGFSKDGTTTNLATYDVNCGTAQATYSWDITSYISSWTDIDKLRLSVTSLDPGGAPTIGLWYVDYHRVLVTSTATQYEVNVEHTSQQVTQLIPNITQIVVVDNFKFSATVTAHLEWYNWATSSWVNINTGSVGTTEVTWSKTWTSGFSSVISGTGYMKVRLYTSSETASHNMFEDHLYWNVTYTLPDTTPPTWSNAGTTNHVAGQSAVFHVKWTDDVGLSGFIFGTNNTGTWVNDAWTPMTGATNWSNVTKILSSTLGALIQWRVRANDTSNNWGDTGILATVLNKAPIAIFTESAETVNIGEVIHFNATSSYDPDGYIVKYFWEFGDGTNTTILTVENSVSATSPYIRVVPTSTVDTRLTPGSLYTVSIYTNYTGADINSWQFTLKYNSSILNIAIDGLNKTETWTGTGTKKSFEATGKLIVPDSEKVYVGATLMIKPDNYTIDYRTGMITFKIAPASGAQVKATYKYALSNGDLITTAKDPSAMFNPGTYNNTAGRLELTGAFFFFIFEPAPITSGPGTLAYLTFTVVGTGCSEVTLGNETKLIGYTEGGYGDPYDIINGQTMPDHLQHGSFSNIITVDHSYASAGTYKVTLTVTDEHGTSGSVSANKTVLSVGAPVADFTYSPPTPYTGETVTFNAATSYDPDGYIVSYAWDFGDSNKGTGNITTHSYTDDGTYTVTLNVTDNDGLWDTYSATVTVRNRPPVASFTENATTVLTGKAISFDASASHDPDGSVISYFWDFGDGKNASGVTTTHSYVDNGTYTVTLTVTDDDGATDTATSTKTVLNRPPVASFTESATSVPTGTVIHFDASASYDPDGSIVSYAWNFGDGYTGTGVTIDHSYADNGTYTVTLTVTDNDGATASTNATKIIQNRPPVALFTESKTTVYTGEVIHFDASTSSDPDGSIVSYFWNFGDGNTGTGVTIDHSYADNGTYTVTLTVRDNDGATGLVTHTKTVLNRPPVASFTESAETVYTGTVIHFDASASSDPDGSIVSYAWNFGDGYTGTGVTIDHSYADNGTYTVTLTVKDNDGATGIATHTKTILNRPPVASFTESATSVPTGTVIHFDASASYDPDGSIVSYSWNFGDGYTGTGVTIDHSYADNGTYTVTLTVTDNDGATDTANATKTVLNRPPVAIFTESAETVGVGETISFNASTSYDPDGSIVKYFWNFGDGKNATGVTTTHSYSSAGTYTVTLTVTDDDGATASANATKTVLENLPPVALFTENATIVFIGEAILFNASASYDPDGTIASYYWDFGDVVITTNTASPSANSGAWTNPQNAYGSNNVYATTSTNLAEHTYYNYGIAGSGSITKVEVIVEWYASSAKGTLEIYVSWDGGSTWSSKYTVPNRLIDGQDLVDVTGATTWTWAKLSNSNFRVKVKAVRTSAPTPTWYLDWVAVRVTGMTGGTATGKVVTYSYAKEGTYTVTLTVTDDDGATASANATKTVLNRPPVASFTESATSVPTGTVIHFDASASYDLDGSIVSYAWNFGDGYTGTGVTIDHSYADNGTYTVTLTVTDNDGATGIATHTKTIMNRPPVASFTESATSVPTGTVIHFDASASSDPDGWIVSYSWNFGDGYTGTGVLIDHSYADNGTYTVTLTVTDNDGATASTNAIKTIQNRPPVALFTESKTTVYTGEVIHFDASTSYDPDGSIVSYSWNFGDGYTGTGVTIDHSYADNGTYTVTLTVKDNDGATGLVTHTKTVLNRPPVAIFTESAESVYINETISFNASLSYDPDGSIVSYFWDFGDGTNATGATTSHSYTAIGNYTVTLTVTDNDGATASAEATKFIVENLPPIALFSENATRVLTGEVISFNASASYDPDGSIVKYFWNFGDGTNATGVTTSHSYVDDGVYTVTLTVTDNMGGTGSTKATKTVLNRPPVAEADGPYSGYEGSAITFDASGSTDVDGTIVLYEWDWDNNGIYDESTASPLINHTWTDDYAGTVGLRVTDDDGQTDTATASVTVENIAPTAYAGDEKFVNEAVLVSFNGGFTDPGAGDTHTIFWDFGDGSNATGTLTPTHAYGDNGVYTVTLKVTDDDAGVGIDTLTVTVYNVAPVVNAGPDRSVYVGQNVTFSGSFTDPGWLDTHTIFWDFGDGDNTTGTLTPTHSYAGVGVYTVTLKVTDDDGGVGSDTLNVTVSSEVVHDVAVLNVTTNTTAVVQGFEVKITVVVRNEGTETESFNVIVYANTTEVGTQTVNNLGAGNQKTLSFIWDTTGFSPGNYTVKAEVPAVPGELPEDLGDNVSIADMPCQVDLNDPPIADANGPYVTEVGEGVQLDGTGSVDPNEGCGDSIVKYEWDLNNDGKFGDVNGSWVYVTWPEIVAFGLDYPAIPNTIGLRVTDRLGLTDTATTTLTIYENQPVAVIEAYPNVTYTGVSISFNGSSSYHKHPLHSIVLYEWDFDYDNVTFNVDATGSTTTHSYSDGGNYTVALRVTDDNVPAKTDIATVLIRVKEGPIAEANGPYEGNEGSPITFDASGSTPNGGTIVLYEWDWNNDGSYDESTTSPTINHTWTDDYVGTAGLRVTDSEGLNDTDTALVTVHNVAPTVFAGPDQTVNVGQTVSFNGSFTDPGSDTHTIFWDFGDGNNETGILTPTHVYTKAGVYTVTLNVTDDDGGSGVDTLTVTVLGVEVYDIAVTSVSVEYPWGADETDGAYPSWTVDVSVTVKNNGTVTTNCTVALYYHNGSAWVKIGTKSVTNLAPCNNVTLRFAWSLLGVPYCNRTLKAVATLIGGVDTNPANNEGYSWVKVKMAGDVDGDGDVDADDVFMYVSPSYGSVFGTPRYDPRCDFDGDGDVDPDDVFMYLAPNYGKVYTCT